MSSMTQKQQRVLYWSHAFAGSGHILSACFILGFGSQGGSWSPSLEFSHEYWTPTECGFNKTLGGGDECFTQSRIIDTFSYSILAVCVIFAAWSGLGHFFTLWKWDQIYLPQLKRGTSKIRWGDYILSSSLMITTIAIFSGIVDVWAILCIAVLQAVVIVLGMISEQMILPRQQWGYFWISCIVYIAGVWLPLLATFGQSMGNIPSSRGNLPVILGVGFGAFFLVYTSFAIVAFWNLKTGFKNYLGCELAYIILSLVSKTLLHWVLFYSLLNRSETLTNDEFSPSEPSNIASELVYQVVGFTVGGGILMAIVVGWLWKKYAKTTDPNPFVVDRDLLLKDLQEEYAKNDSLLTARATHKALKGFHVN